MPAKQLQASKMPIMFSPWDFQVDNFKCSRFILFIFNEVTNITRK